MALNAGLNRPTSRFVPIDRHPSPTLPPKRRI